MNKSPKIIGVIVIILLLVLGVVIFWSIQKQPGVPVKNQSTQILVTPTQTAALTPTTSPGTSQYTAEFRAKARSTFVANCTAKLGQQYMTGCICGADYLAAHYTDEELTKIYLEYHTSSQIPKEIQEAYNACK